MGDIDYNNYNPYYHLRLTTPNELRDYEWYAIETRDGRLYRQIQERYNDIIKYEY